MGLKKGMTNNPNGRKPGTPNKVTTDLRQAVNLFLGENWEDLKVSYKKLEPKDKMAFYEKMMQYSLPRLSSVSSDVNISNSLEKLSDEQLSTLINQILQSDES